MDLMGQRIKSTRWNLDRRTHLVQIIAGVPCKATQDSEGFYLVSRHAAGVNSAYVYQNRLRRLHPQLITKVINKRYDKTAWDAEIWVKLDDTAITA